jgi:hypothetical protein
MGCTDGMMLALDQAGAQHSQSPVGDALRVPEFWSVLRTSGNVNSLQDRCTWNKSHAGTSAKMANLFDQTPEEPRPVWMPVPPVFEEKPKPNDDDAERPGPPPQIQNRPLRF